MRRSLRRAITPCLGICALLYFCYHTVQGDRGIIAYLRLNAQLERTEMALLESGQAREALARQVRLLRPENLNRDMLDEQARRTLGLAHPDDIVIYTP
jgi:cell division protein FtsB